MSRKNGYYRVKYAGDWCVAYWEELFIGEPIRNWVCGFLTAAAQQDLLDKKDSFFEDIDENIILMPDDACEKMVESRAPFSEKHTVLEEANELIFGERAKAYGNADANFRRIAAGWSVILGTTVTPEQVGLCMAWLKIARQVGKPNRDNLVDAAGYIGCVEKVQKGE